MKHIIFLFGASMIASLSAVAQMVSYPIVEDGKVWYYKASRSFVSPKYRVEWDEIYSLEGDTVINSHQCLKLYVTSSSPYNPYDHTYKGALCEEGEKVYYIAQDNSTPTLIYDFSCESGAMLTVNNYELTINEKKLVKYHGRDLIAINWTPMESDACDLQYYWLEGIGSETDLMNETPVWLDGGISKYLVTCKQQDQIIYDRDEYIKTAQFVTEDEVTFTTGQMATIILPTEPDASRGKYYRLDRCEKGQIIFEQELQPQARVPYIIVPDEDFSIASSTLDLAGLSSDTVSIGGISFIGSYVCTELPASTGGDGNFYYDIIDTTPDCTPLPGEGQGVRLFIGAMRAYLLVNCDDPIYYGGTRGKQEKPGIVLKDDETGIDGIQNSEFKNQNEEGSIIYDLSGRRVNNSKFKVQSSKPQRGIYIEKGRKVVK